MQTDQILNPHLQSFIYNYLMAASQIAALGRVLLVASTKDMASMNIARCLLARSEYWHPTLSPHLYVGRQNAGVLLWVQDVSLLALDEPHIQLHQNEPDAMRVLTESSIATTFSEVIFLSRHSAASGVAALTVHPIGIPWLTHTRRGRYGGIGARCSPPSPRIASLYRLLLQVSRERSLKVQSVMTVPEVPVPAPSFEITLEATHHGPYCSLPTCFVEIGSDITTWNNADAGQIWADVLGQELQLGPAAVQLEKEELAPISGETSAQVAVIVIGGSHYMPKGNDSARLGPHVRIGHMLATYALQALSESASPSDEVHEEDEEDGVNQASHVIFLTPEQEQFQPTIRSAMQEVLASTQISLTSSPASAPMLYALVDKKCGGAEIKAAVVAVLEEAGVQWGHTVNDLKRALDQRNKSEQLHSAATAAAGARGKYKGSVQRQDPAAASSESM